jgi:hypothetical protein
VVRNGGPSGADRSIAVLVEAAQRAVGVTDAEEPPMVVVDGGVENFNGDVDKLINSGVLRRGRSRAAL